MKYTRNEFLKLTGLGITSAAILPAAGAISNAPAHKEEKFRLGLASYTFKSFSLDDTIKWSKQLGLNYISLKDSHMPLQTSDEDLKKIAEKIKAAGLTLYGAGVIYMKTPEEVDNAFRYAKAAGLEMIIGVPNHELLPQVNELVKKHDIKLAIHNHGPGDKLYTSPSDVYDKVKDLDQRIGLCIDVGHVVRIGLDPAVMISRYKDRLLDMHMKDEDKNVAEGKPLEIGHGVIDIPKIIKTLKKIGYAGVVGFEYEKDMDAPLAGLAESVGYVRGVMKMT
ncbi:MAG: sugar phosphate isomerase/epimerase [Chitinophagaceae bacterium]